MKVFHRRGILIGWPTIATMVLAWVLPLSGFFYLTNRNAQLIAVLDEHMRQIEEYRADAQYLRERLRLLEAIEGRQTNLTPDEEAHLARHIWDQSAEHNIDPYLLLAVVEVESDYDRWSVSPMGACGLMQVKPSTARAVTAQLGWKWPGDDHLFDPGFNIALAAQYLSDLVAKFGSVEDALIAYNTGETHMRLCRSAGEPLPQTYVRRVLLLYNWLKRRYDDATPPLPSE